MCGIAGFCNHPTNWKENIHRMNERMLHRGPDAGGFWANEDASVYLDIADYLLWTYQKMVHSRCSQPPADICVYIMEKSIIIK